MSDPHVHGTTLLAAQMSIAAPSYLPTPDTFRNLGYFAYLFWQTRDAPWTRPTLARSRGVFGTVPWTWGHDDGPLAAVQAAHALAFKSGRTGRAGVIAPRRGRMRQRR